MGVYQTKNVQSLGNSNYKKSLHGNGSDWEEICRIQEILTRLNRFQENESAWKTTCKEG
jgi:hypothetical protein